jgi:hypothetical protein
LLGPINRTLEGWGSWSLLELHLVFPRLGVSQEPFLVSNQMREGGDLRGCMNLISILVENFIFDLVLCYLVLLFALILDLDDTVQF